jgi:NitT/TauT family transport system permease protein
LFRAINVKGWAFVVAVTVLLEAIVRAGLISDYFPPPTVMLTALAEGLISGEISSQIGATLLAYAEGLALAAILAVFVGILMGAFKTFYNAVKVIVELLRPVPAVSLIPLAILLFGLGYGMRVFVIAFAAFWPILINTFYGVRAVDPVAIDTARNFGISGARILWRVTLPSALPSIATGFRISAAIALVLTITAELIAGNSGIGYYVAQTELANRLPEMYAGILFAGILGYALNLLFRTIEQRVLFWGASHQDEAI